jgi:hypothetical protein
VIALHSTLQDGAMMRRWTGYELCHLADPKGFMHTRVLRFQIPVGAALVRGA